MTRNTPKPEPLSLENFYFQQYHLLQNGDVLLQYFDQQRQIYRISFMDERFCVGRGQIDPAPSPAKDNGPFETFRRFNSPDAAWAWFAADPEWFKRFHPLGLAPGVRLSNFLFAKHIIHLGNQVRHTTRLDRGLYDAIRSWETAVYSPEISSSEYNQRCAHCGERVVYNPRYPAYICRECVKLLTDAEGRKVAYYNTTALGGGCQGYYEGGENKYDEPFAFIGAERFQAQEARFGGIVVERRDV